MSNQYFVQNSFCLANTDMLTLSLDSLLGTGGDQLLLPPSRNEREHYHGSVHRPRALCGSQQREPEGALTEVNAKGVRPSDDTAAVGSVDPWTRCRGEEPACTCMGAAAKPGGEVTTFNAGDLGYADTIRPR